MFGRRSRVDRLEEAFIRLENSHFNLDEQVTRTNNLLERVIAIQERQQSRLDQHDANFERMLNLIRGY